MKAKSLVLILIVISMLLSSFLARAAESDDILRFRYYFYLIRGFSTSCTDFPQASLAGFTSSSRMALIVSGKLEVVTSIYKQKGCIKLGRVEYMKGPIVIKDGMAQVLVTEKYITVDESLSAEAMSRMGARIPRSTENALLPSHLGEILQDFRKPNRLNYVADFKKPEERILQLDLDASTENLPIRSVYGTIVLTRN